MRKKCGRKGGTVLRIVRYFQTLAQTLSLIRGDLHFLIVGLRDIETRIGALEATAQRTAESARYLEAAERNARHTAGRTTNL
jgi:hypothetical protein